MQSVNEKEDTLQIAFEHVMGFRPLQANNLIIADENIKRLSSEEAKGGKVVASVSGITPGMRSAILQPARSFLSQWEKTRSDFDREIHPYRQDIESVEQVGSEIVRMEVLKDKQISQIKLQADADPTYKRARESSEEADNRYREIKSREGGREANVAAYSFFYWPAIMMIGITEWLINYDTFFSFLSVPAIAAGATVILGILLAFAAHSHGTILKQWSYLFADERSASQRRVTWRFLFLATFSLLLVLSAAGGARYESAIRVVVHLSEGPSGVNILGSDATIEASPVRDVLLSLLANVAAWAVGVFLAYLTHDENPSYMDAAKDRRIKQRKYIRLHKKKVLEDSQTEEARVRKGISELDASSKDRRSNVEAEYNMWKAVKERDNDVRQALSGVIKHNLELYRDALFRIEGLEIFVEGRQVNRQDYYQMAFRLDEDLNLGYEKKEA